MGAVTFGIPIDLASALVEAGGLTAAVETGTYLGDSAIALRRLVPKVWSIELIPAIYERAKRRVHDDAIFLSCGYSPQVLAKIRDEVERPVLFWLDGHGGTIVGSDMPDGYPQCPVLEELAVIETYVSAAESCIMIDDARAFFGPMLQHNPEEWPTFLEVSDRLRAGANRYVTVLDDVIIAVPARLRSTVDSWWSSKLLERHGYEAMQLRIEQLADPTPREAAMRLARSLLPAGSRQKLSQWLFARGMRAPAPRKN